MSQERANSQESAAEKGQTIVEFALGGLFFRPWRLASWSLALAAPRVLALAGHAPGKPSQVLLLAGVQGWPVSAPNLRRTHAAHAVGRLLSEISSAEISAWIAFSEVEERLEKKKKQRASDNLLRAKMMEAGQLAAAKKKG